MTPENKGIIANGIILQLNSCLEKKNAELVRQNLPAEQTPLHGFDMYLKLIYMEDAQLTTVAIAAGL